MSQVELIGAGKSFGEVDVIHDVDLSIEQGELVVFVGPSGCGKSTLLRLICGLEHLSRGEVKIDGMSMKRVDPARRGVAMVFQSYALYPHMNVADNMGFALRMEGVKKAERRARVEEAARILQLEALLDRLPKQLSGGQRQRVAIGRAIVRHPKVFLFDEPLSNLDAELRVQMRQEIAGLHRMMQATMIYVTHDQVEAMTMADRIVVLRAGRIEQIGPPSELYARPANLFVAGFIGSPRMNLLAARVTALGAGTADILIDGPAPVSLRLPVAPDTLAPGDTVTVGIRPEHIEANADGPVRIEVETAFVENLGNTRYLHAPAHPAGAMVIESRGDGPLAAGPLTVSLSPERCHLFGPAGLRLTPDRA